LSDSARMIEALDRVNICSRTSVAPLGKRRLEQDHI
jgi:hypothetical protein